MNSRPTPPVGSDGATSALNLACHVHWHASPSCAGRPACRLRTHWVASPVIAPVPPSPASCSIPGSHRACSSCKHDSGTGATEVPHAASPGASTSLGTGCVPAISSINARTGWHRGHGLTRPQSAQHRRTKWCCHPPLKVACDLTTDKGHTVASRSLNFFRRAM